VTDREVLSRLVEFADDLYERTDHSPPLAELKYARALMRKLQLHAAAALSLSAGIAVSPNMGHVVLDWASLDVLARACLETLITFDSLFVQPQTPDDGEYRYCAWMLAGFVQRQNFPTHTADEEAKREDEKEQILAFYERIKRTNRFTKLKAGGQDQVVNHGKWEFRSLGEMSQKAFGSVFGKALYSVLSSYAHSTPLSVSQILDTTNPEDQQDLVSGALAIIAKCIALMNCRFSEFFPGAKRIWNEHAAHTLNEEWSRIAPVDADHQPTLHTWNKLVVD
jgi:hypothetical protein